MKTFKLRKIAHTPILKGIARLNEMYKIPWKQNTKLKIEWTN